MLMRFARYAAVRPCSVQSCCPWQAACRRPKSLITARSLVLETIPQHANFGKGGRREYEQERFKEVLYWPRLKG